MYKEFHIGDAVVFKSSPMVDKYYRDMLGIVGSVTSVYNDVEMGCSGVGDPSCSKTCPRIFYTVEFGSIIVKKRRFL